MKHPRSLLLPCALSAVALLSSCGSSGPESGSSDRTFLDAVQTFFRDNSFLFGVLSFLLIFLWLAAILVLVILWQRKEKERKNRRSVLPQPWPRPEKPVVAPGFILVLRDLRQPEQTWSIPLREKISIGRDASCDLLLEDRTVSRVHCHIWNNSGRLFLEDNHSTNHTRKNGVLIQGMTDLCQGDTLKLGREELRVEQIGPYQGSPDGRYPDESLSRYPPPGPNAPGRGFNRQN